MWKGKYQQRESKGIRYARQQIRARLFWSFPHTCEQDSVTELAMGGHLYAEELRNWVSVPLGKLELLEGSESRVSVVFIPRYCWRRYKILG